MAEACEYVEKVVNAEMRKRPRFALEWGGEPGSNSDDTSEPVIWRANVAASNRYEGTQESVGFHTDQLTNIGPYATIASLSLGRSSWSSDWSIDFMYVRDYANVSST